MFLFPGATYRPVESHSGPMSAHLGLVMHSQEGNNSPFGWFANKANEASSNLWVAKGGGAEQYVDGDLIAWAQKDGNATYNSVEFEGFVSEPLTDAQILTAAALYVAGHNRYGWPLVLAEVAGNRGFGWHGMNTAWGHPDCPGVIRRGQRGAILYVAALQLGGTVQTPGVNIFKPLGGHVGKLNAPVVATVPTFSGQGYTLVAADGGTFNHGDAPLLGSLANIKLNAPIVDAARTPDGKGLVLVATDGGVFCLGSAVFEGSEGGHKLNLPVVGVGLTPTGKGYWLVAADGGVFTFGDAPFKGGEA